MGGPNSPQINKSKMSDDCILKNKKVQYLHNGLTDFDKICHGDVSQPFGLCQPKNVVISKIQDGGRLS